MTEPAHRPQANTQFIVAAIAVVAIFAIGAGASVSDSKNSIGYMGGAAALNFAMLAILKGISEYHAVVNSRMDEYLVIKERLDKLLGAEVERDRAAEDQKVVSAAKDATKVADRKITEADRKITESDRRITEADRADKQ